MTPPPEAGTPRAKLHHSVRKIFSSAVARYYKQNPQWFNDERGRKGVSALLLIMHEVLNCIDEFEVCDVKGSETDSGQ